MGSRSFLWSRWDEGVNEESQKDNVWGTEMGSMCLSGELDPCFGYVADDPSVE